MMYPVIVFVSQPPLDHFMGWTMGMGLTIIEKFIYEMEFDGNFPQIEIEMVTTKCKCMAHKMWNVNFTKQNSNYLCFSFSTSIWGNSLLDSSLSNFSK